MHLESLSYCEYWGREDEWSLSDLELGRINLIVGKNASGKTRVLNVINALAALLSGKQNQLFISGRWDATFSTGEGDSPEGRMKYFVEMDNHAVRMERVLRDRRALVARKDTGEGRLYAEGLRQHINFRVGGDQLIAVARRDSLQHPYLEHLFNWANSVRHYRFGTDLGRSNAALFVKAPPGVPPPAPPLDDAIPAFKASIEKFGDQFTTNVLNDLADIGYECEDIGLAPNPRATITSSTPLQTDPQFLYVKERDLSCRTLQTEMSQGMYRALAVIVLVNAGLLWGTSQTVLIDDIGEGLDFQRSTRLLSNLVGKAKDNALQLVMTTNDRFVMNAVPLEYWAFLRRQGNAVSVMNAKNSKKLFRDFKYLGLNNFDFFTAQYPLSDGDNPEVGGIR